MSQLFQEGELAEVSFDDFTVANGTSGKTLKAVPVPESLISMMRRGGIMPLLESEGFIAPRTAAEELLQSAQQ